MNAVQFYKLALLILALAVFAPDKPTAAPQESDENLCAVVLDVKGDVWIGEDSHDKLKSRNKLNAGTLTLEPGSSALLAFKTTGHMERVSADNQRVSTKLTADGTAAADGLKIKKIPGKLPANSLAFLPKYSGAGAGEARESIDPPRPLIKPVFESVVVETQPVLAWPAEAGVERYTITVFGALTNAIVFSAESTQAHVQVSDKLEPGIYGWKVTVPSNDLDDREIAAYVVEGKEEPVTKTFKIAPGDWAHEVDVLLKMIKESPDEPGVLRFCAVWFAREGFVSQATEAYEALQKLDDKDAAVQVALYELYSRAGRAEDAAKARANAEHLGFDFSKSKD